MPTTHKMPFSFGDKLPNGATVIECAKSRSFGFLDTPTESQHFTVLARFGDEYVVWSYVDQNGNCECGRYSADLSLALKNFKLSQE